MAPDDFLQWMRNAVHDPEYIRYRDRIRRCERITNPLKRIPFVGPVAAIFWFLVLSEGDPRDGMAFSYLNDGMRPTLWHTWKQVTRPDGDPYVGIWPGGAPRSRADADAKMEVYKHKSRP